MQPQKHTVTSVPVRDAAPVGAGFGSTLANVDLQAIERKARQDRAAIIGAWIGDKIGNFVLSLRAAHRRRVAMAELNALDSRMLADIGITRGDIRAAVAGASGFMPRVLGAPASAPSLNDDSVRGAA
jgi:uncharacterized protein YjiS (DUF1127 family)